MGLGVVSRNAAMAGDVATFTSCAKCGSGKFAQRRIWKESEAEADFEGADE
jgi:hypothetical protein